MSEASWSKQAAPLEIPGDVVLPRPVHNINLSTQAPFQWAAIFHKTDINFLHGHHNLAWYDSVNKSQAHHLPCKVQCAYCRTPIMDEGRNMILVFPTLIEGIHTQKGRVAFAVQSHMFYPRRVVELRDGLPKYMGLSGESETVDEVTGEVVVYGAKEL